MVLLYFFLSENGKEESLLVILNHLLWLVCVLPMKRLYITLTKANLEYNKYYIAKEIKVALFIFHMLIPLSMFSPACFYHFS